MISIIQLGAKTAQGAGLGLSWKEKCGCNYCVTDSTGFGVAGE